MTDTDPTYRSQIDPPAESVELRDADELDDEDGMMEIRMPIASTGEVRNEDDEPLSGEEIRGMASQVADLTRGVFPEHGKGNFVSHGKYSQFEKLGYWADGEVEENAADDGEDLLIATARLADPETLPPATGDYQEALAILKEQAKRGIPIGASIGWRDDENAPGGNDLMEASIVGIGADPRTTTEGGTEALARAAVDAGADPGDLLAEVARAVAPDDERPFGPPNNPNQWESFDECVNEVENWDGIDDPEAFCGWAKAQTENADAGETESEQDTDDMTDDTNPDEGTDQEQTADDGEPIDRAPGEVELLDWAELLASHIDGVDSADLMDAWEPFAQDYVGEVDVRELAAFVGDVVDEETGTVMDFMEEAMGGQEQATDDDEDEEDDDEEQYADGPDETQDPDDDLRERVAELEETLEAVRSGEVDVDTPDTEPEDEQDADDGEESTRATAGPNWRQ